MSKWIVSVNWQKEYEADDEGDALMQADGDFDLCGEARAEEVCDYEDEVTTKLSANNGIIPPLYSTKHLYLSNQRSK